MAALKVYGPECRIMAVKVVMKLSKTGCELYFGRTRTF